MDAESSINTFEETEKTPVLSENEKETKKTHKFSQNSAQIEQLEEQTNEEDDHEHEKHPNKIIETVNNARNIVAFFLCGLMNNYSYVVMLTAAEHLMSGQGGIILLCDIIPDLALKMVAPFFMHLLPYNLRILIVVILSILAFQFVAWFEWVPLKLLGVCFASVGCGLGEITFLAMTSYYNKSVVTGWSSGTGGAGIAGSFTYLVCTSWFGLSNKATLNVITILPLIMLFSTYFLMTGNHWRKGKGWKDIVHFCSLAHLSNKKDKNKKNEAPLIKRIIYILPLMRFMIPLFVVYFAEYLINQSLFANLTFRKHWIKVKDQYTYYQFLYQCGVFISRSSVNIFPIKRIWIPSALQVFNFVFLFIDAYFRIIPMIYIIFVIIFWEGLLGGAVYVNAFYNMSVEIPKEFREFSLGLVSVSDTFGISCSALTSIFLQPWVKAHQRRAAL